MVPQIAFEVLTGIRDAASMLTGAIRRRFQAEIATKYCNASPRQTESWFGFNRHAVKRGLLEKESGKTLRNSPERRGRPKVEVKQPQLAQLTDKALSETAQMDPKFQTSMATCPLLVPCGILEIVSGQLTIGFGQGTSTSDTVADNLEQWWSDRKAVQPHIRKLMIDLDNGPEVSSRRTQFMKRLTQFADKHNLEIELVYYPPYHSKYNAIERCWGALEKHWNGTLLTTIPIVLSWAQSMTWKGIRPIVRMLHGVYRRGVKLSKAEYAPTAARLQRTVNIEKWSVNISPQLFSTT